MNFASLLNFSPYFISAKFHFHLKQYIPKSGLIVITVMTNRKNQMASTNQLTGMRGVYLVAAELSKLGFIASPTSRSAIGADILVTDQACQRAYSVQVKTNARTFGFWLLTKKAREQISESHIYVFVNIRTRKLGETVDFYVVPSKIVAEKMSYSTSPRADWYDFKLIDAAPYKDNWLLFGASV
jgi:hypothetical protein